MKKIKLLTGLSTLSILGLSSLPLTSCSKSKEKEFDGTVTEAEWQDAIGYMCGNSDQDMYWRFSKDDYAVEYYEEKSNEIQWVKSYTDWITTPTGIYLKEDDNQGSETDYTYELFTGNFGYCVDIVLEFGLDFYVTRLGPYFALSRFFSSIYSYYKNFNFNNGYYSYSGTMGDVVSLNSKLAFNKDKKMSSIETTFIIKSEENSTESITFATNIHFDYTHKDIDWPQDLLDRCPKHVFNLTNSEGVQHDLSCYTTEDEGFVLNISPDKDYSKVVIYDGSQVVDPNHILDDYQIMKNGKVISSTDYEITNECISFKQPITKDDLVSINFFPDEEYCKTYTFKLA